MTRSTAVLVVMLLLSACSGVSPSSTPPAGSPTAPLTSSASAKPTASPVGVPSNACGGFHLKVVNETSGNVVVTINGTFTVIVPAAASDTVVEFLPPEKPPMPWTVVLTTSAGTEIGTQTFAGPVDQQLTVSDGGLTVEPYDIREDGC